MTLKITKKSDTIERDYEGVTLIIAQTNNLAFRNKRDKLLRALKRNQQFSKLPAEQQDELISRAMGGTVLVGWKNFPGNVAFSEENAEDLLINDIDAREYVSLVASDLAEFLLEEKADLQKKSATPIAGA